MVENIREDIAGLNTKNRGFFDSIDSLREAYPEPEVGDYAIVKSNNKWYICLCEEAGVWELTEEEYKPEEPEKDYVTQDDINDFLKTEDFKKINGYSLIKVDNDLEDITIPTGDKLVEPLNSINNAGLANHPQSAN